MSKTKKQQLDKPVWLKYTESEVKAIILKLSEKGLTSEKIGLVLRDQYGIPKVKIYNLKINKVLKEHNKLGEPGLINLEKKLEELDKHNKKNRKDRVAERSVIITKAKIKKQKEYLEKKR
jgi:small subunit ribosomal protein S15